MISWSSERVKKSHKRHKPADKLSAMLAWKSALSHLLKFSDKISKTFLQYFSDRKSVV